MWVQLLRATCGPNVRNPPESKVSQWRHKAEPRSIPCILNLATAKLRATWAQRGRGVKILVGILAALAAVLFVFILQEHGATDVLRAENAKLRAQLADTSAAEKIACAGRAEAAFRALGYSEKGGSDSAGNLGDSYNNHYNQTLKRCLMVVVSTSFHGANETVIQSIFDVDERTDFGDYGWVSSGTKKYWEQPPIQCSMKLPGKSESVCRSTAEWDTYIKSLME